MRTNEIENEIDEIKEQGKKKDIKYESNRYMSTIFINIKQ